MKNRLRTLRSSVVVALLLIASSVHAQVPDFDAMVVFGDSLADNGNDFLTTKLFHADPAVPPSVSPHRTYFNGRFSNGYVAFEYLWQMVGGGAPGTLRGMRPSLLAPLLPLNAGIAFAFGGTGTPLLDQTPGGFYAPGLKGQVELYKLGLRGRKPLKKTLYAIITGANDYRADQFNTPMPIEEVVGNIIESVRSLYAIGARDVMVVNLPDLGLVPSNAGNSQEATQLSLAHNAALSAALDQLQKQLPKLKLLRADLFQAFSQLPPLNITVPALEVIFAGNPTIPPGFPISACLFIDPATCKNVPPSTFNSDLGFLFWDVVHPTNEAHRSLARYFYTVLQAGY